MTEPADKPGRQGSSIEARRVASALTLLLCAVQWGLEDSVLTAHRDGLAEALDKLIEVARR